jgi:hypothetical protein
VFKIDIGYYQDTGDFASQGMESIRIEKKFGFFAPQEPGCAPPEPDIPEDRVPGRGAQDHGCNILSEDHFLAVAPVEKEIKMDFGMILYDPSKSFIGEPADTIKLTRHQKTGVNGNRGSVLVHEDSRHQFGANLLHLY